jgi:hypothetical protein
MGLKEDPVLDVVGVKTGFLAVAGGAPPEETGAEPPAVYLAPEAFETFSMMDSGSRSLSERAVISTWYPWRIFSTAERWLVK